MPASKPPAFKEGERLIKISELPEWMQPAFEGMKELNRIQSRVSQTAMYTSENILMCAPTGAGKTNVAMLTILQEVSCYILPSNLFLATMQAFSVTCLQPVSLEPRPLLDLRLASPGTCGQMAAILLPCFPDSMVLAAADGAASTQRWHSGHQLLQDRVRGAHEGPGG